MRSSQLWLHAASDCRCGCDRTVITPSDRHPPQAAAARQLEDCVAVLGGSLTYLGVAWCSVSLRKVEARSFLGAKAFSGSVVSKQEPDPLMQVHMAVAHVPHRLQS